MYRRHPMLQLQRGGSRGGCLCEAKEGKRFLLCLRSIRPPKADLSSAGENGEDANFNFGGGCFNPWKKNSVITPSYTVEARLDIGEVTAVLNTVSPISLLEKNQIPENVSIDPYFENVKFEGINKTPISVLGRLKHVKIRDTEVLIYFYVVPRITMSYTCLLGRDFISEDSIEIRFGKIATIRKRSSATETDTVIHEIMNIDVANDASESNALNLNANQEIAWEERDRVKILISECT